MSDWRTKRRKGYKCLTQEQVREIRELYKTGEITQEALAWEFDVEQSTISKIIRRATWQNVA